MWIIYHRRQVDPGAFFFARPLPHPMRHPEGQLTGTARVFHLVCTTDFSLCADLHRPTADGCQQSETKALLSIQYVKERSGSGPCAAVMLPDKQPPGPQDP